MPHTLIILDNPQSLVIGFDNPTVLTVQKTSTYIFVEKKFVKNNTKEQMRKKPGKNN